MTAVRLLPSRKVHDFSALAALTAANAGIRANVCSLLSAFINQTTAQSGKALTIDEANQLIANANRIENVLRCQ